MTQHLTLLKKVLKAMIHLRFVDLWDAKPQPVAKACCDHLAAGYTLEKDMKSSL